MKLHKYLSHWVHQTLLQKLKPPTTTEEQTKKKLLINRIQNHAEQSKRSSISKSKLKLNELLLNVRSNGKIVYLMKVYRVPAMLAKNMEIDRQ